MIWFIVACCCFFLLFNFRVWCVYCALSCQIHTAPWLYPISVRSLFICICLRVRTFWFRVYGRIFQEAPSQILFPSSVSRHAIIWAFVILSLSFFYNLKSRRRPLCIIHWLTLNLYHLLHITFIKKTTMINYVVAVV